MQEYQFQYNNINKSWLLVCLCILTFIIIEFLCIHLKLNIFLTIALSLGVTFLLFKKLKGRVVSNCIAKLSETSLIFEFENIIRIINFDDLISYKAYYGQNGVEFFLKSKTDNFKISVNSYYCKTDNFESFCKDTIIQLDKYKSQNNLSLIHKGSIFATKGMLYFLVVATLIYMFGFFIETKTLRLAIGIGGGFYLFIMWIAYSNKSRLKSR